MKIVETHYIPSEAEECKKAFLTEKDIKIVKAPVYIFPPKTDDETCFVEIPGHDGVFLCKYRFAGFDFSDVDNSMDINIKLTPFTYVSKGE